ncbi:TolC family protein [Psychromonas sp. PT13]|uniref:TolC family protein n=1 Tax=Psychromonas sp. PT13 TaxID=3439547 RepID=UPI003EB7027D
MDFGRKFKVTVLALVVSGCSSFSENNFQDRAKESLSQEVNWNVEQVDAVNATKLTDLMNIPELNELIAQALENNPSVQQTLMALKIIYADRTATNSDRIPQLTAGFSGDKEEDSDASYSTDLTISWELDLWNKIGDSTYAADQDIISSMATLQSARDTLAADIMKAWLQINLQQQLIDIESQRLATLENNETFILEKYRSGLGDLEDLDTAKTTTASTRSTLVEYKETLAQNKRSLSLLLGQIGSSQNVDISSEFPTVLTPLASLPEQDLARRPDLQSAYADIEAEAYRTKAAYKALLPSISLEVALSDTASSPSSALLTSPLWSLLGQLSAPLFDGGYLRSQAEIAELTTEKTYWTYQETLLTAVNEVENALGQEKSLALQQQHLQDAYESSLRSFDNYQSKYSEGLVDISDLITAQTNSFNYKENLVEVQYNRLVNRIVLGLALGLGVSQ